MKGKRITLSVVVIIAIIFTIKTVILNPNDQYYKIEDSKSANTRIVTKQIELLVLNVTTTATRTDISGELRNIGDKFKTIYFTVIFYDDQKIEIGENDVSLVVDLNKDSSKPLNITLYDDYSKAKFYRIIIDSVK
ncbi:hypothetical protein [Dehalobacter restrictus]|uniref:hypothetical protein n=1 Tax=Dehalobacter restrictus TaxID=55583 RepID=UPI00338F0758